MQKLVASSCGGTPWVAVLASVFLAIGCGSSERTAASFCGAGTRVESNECVPDITCGEGTTLEGNVCQPTSTGGFTCAAGTVASGTACVVDASACGAGTELQDGGCVATGTASCGAGTIAGEDGCEVDPAVCSTDTTFTEGTCVGTVTCGEGTERVDNACTGLLYCDTNLNVVEVEDAEGVPACVADFWGEVSATTFSAQLAANYCEGLFRCCDPEPLAIPDDRSGDLFEVAALTEVNTCRALVSTLVDVEAGLAEARLLFAEDPPRAEFDLELALGILDFFAANDECQMVIDPDILEQYQQDNIFELLFQGEREEGENCSTTRACSVGLVCRDGNLDVSGTILKCLEPAGTDDPCSQDGDCAGDLLCETNGPDAGTCQPLYGSDDPCLDDRQCASGLSCMRSDGGDQCQDIEDPPVGFRCNSTEDCPDGNFCDEDGDSSACANFLELGAECSFGDQCGPRAFCLEGEGPSVCATAADICGLGLFR